MVFLLQRSLSSVPLFYTKIARKQRTKHNKYYNNTHTTCLITFTRASCVTHLISVVVVVFLLKCYNIPYETICLRLLEFRI